MKKEIIERKNPFCVIAIEPFGEYAVHDIQTNSAWNANPYEDYAVVPDDMVEEIMETKGFCDIVLNEEGTEVVSFTQREIPKIPESVAELTTEERIAELEEQMLAIDEVAVDLYEQKLAQEKINMAQDEAIVTLYEMMGV